MARNIPVLEDERETSTANRSGWLGRRSFLKTAGAATAAAAVGVGTASAADDYDVIEARGQTIAVESGETFENVQFDLSTGQHVTVVAKGTDWTIRNVGFDGQDTSGVGNAMFGVADTGGGESTIENVYMGDGAATGNAGASSGHGTTGIWVDPAHDGHIEMRYVNVQGMSDNGFYASAPGSNGGGGRGTVAFRNCVSSNCHVAQFRIAGGEVENCVGWNDDGFPYDGRCLWVWPTRDGLDVTVEDSDFEHGGGPSAVETRPDGPIDLTIRDSRYSSFRDQGSTLAEENVGDDPDLSIPEGVPETAADAASGAAGPDEGGNDRD